MSATSAPGLHRFRGDLARELNYYHDRGDQIIPAFVRGINVYIDQTATNPDLLPLEFNLLGITPQQWTPAVVISRHQGLVSNVRSEIANARAVALLGADRVKELNYYYGDPDLSLDPVVDVSLLTDDILNLYSAHRRSVRFQPEDIIADYRGDRDTFKRLANALPSEIDLSEDSNQYRYLGRWESMTVIEDTIPVKGEAPVEVELKYTRHGPVLYEDTANHKAYALRAAWLEYGSAPYLASLRMDQAESWEEFREACSYSRIPSENMVWADREKNIGYQAVGVSPIRPNHSGLVPVPGDGRYEWDGYLPIKALPNVVNPRKGFFGTANNYLAPDGYPYWEALHYTWGDQMRAARVEEVLDSRRHMTMVDMIQLQQDELTVARRNIVPLLREIEIGDPEVEELRDRLLDWDFVLDKDSVEAAIYVTFERRLRDNVRGVVVPEEAREVIRRVNTKRMIDWLVAPDGRFGDAPVAGRDSILADTLTQALSDLRERLGPDISTWKYGQEAFKHALIRHPMTAAVSPDLRRRLDVGPVPRGGYGGTVHNTSGGDNQTSGGSFMIVADTADWDNSVGLNTPGQSGNPDSPHYGDLFGLWAKGKYFPIFYSRAKVDSVTESTTFLGPAPSASQGTDAQQ